MSPKTSFQLGNLIETISVRGHQVKTDAYDDGNGYPIVDQGKDLVCGYTDQVEPIECALPVTVFGDHTRETKYIDFPFIAGADGTKVMRGRGLDPRYFHALVEFAATQISNLGYSRHYKSLKEFEFPKLHSKPTQEKIAEILSTWDNALDLAKRVYNKKENRYLGVARRFFLILNDGQSQARLADISTIDRAISGIGAKDVTEDGAPLFTAGGQVGLYDDPQHFGEAVILSAIGARCGRCFRAEGDWTAGANTLIIWPNSDVDVDYLFHYLEVCRPWPIQGSGQPYIGPKQASEAIVPSHTPSEQEIIRDALNALVADLDSQMALINGISRQRNALIHTLLFEEVLS